MTAEELRTYLSDITIEIFEELNILEEIAEEVDDICSLYNLKDYGPDFALESMFTWRESQKGSVYWDSKYFQIKELYHDFARKYLNANPHIKLQVYSMMIHQFVNGCAIGLCGAFRETKLHSSYSIVKSFYLSDFDEIIKRKPMKTEMFWWKPSNKSIRIKVLNAAIEEVKQQIKNS